MGKKGKDKNGKKKLTKKEKKRINHLKLLKGKADQNNSFHTIEDKNKKAA